MNTDKTTVQAFYDNFGWDRSADGDYQDTRLFMDRRPVMREYMHKVHRRVLDFLQPHGRYFLDAGSGAIAHPEYLEYSRGYQWRVCVDLSAAALGEARSKLGEKGLCVIADLTRLPFQEGAFDGVVCAHVLYHVPKDEQQTALLELVRALRLNRSAVVIYHWATSVPTRLAFLLNPRLLAARFRRRLAALRKRWARPSAPAAGTTVLEISADGRRPPLYFHAHNYHWFQSRLAGVCRFEVRCWRFVDRFFSRTFIPNNALGRLLLQLIFSLETRFPRGMARLGSYPMIILMKES